MKIKLTLVFALVITTSLKVAYAQESFFFDDYLHEIIVSDLQYEKLTQIEHQLNHEIDQLRKGLQTTQQKLSQHQSGVAKALEAELTTEQLKILNEKRRSNTIQTAKVNAEFMVKFARYLEAVSSAEDLLIYEGLPRAPEVTIEKLKKGNETIEVDGWSFYAEPLPAKSSTMEQLRSTLAEYRTFKPYIGSKFCGGFHPDFCVQWRTGDKAYYVQICLGCREAVFISPDEKMKFDFNGTAGESFTQIGITTFRKHGDILKRRDRAIGR